MPIFFFVYNAWHVIIKKENGKRPKKYSFHPFWGIVELQGPPKNLPRSIYPISSIDTPKPNLSLGLRRSARWEMKYTTNNSTRSVNIKITLQTGSPDRREINKRIICQSEDFSVDAVANEGTVNGDGVNVSGSRDLLSNLI